MLNPRILLTTGEPAGIGPDLLIAIAREPFDCALTVIGDVRLLENRAQLLGKALRIRSVGADERAPLHEPGCLNVWSTRHEVRTDGAGLDPENAPYVLETIAEGARACLRGRFDALVTAPVHKGILNAAGVRFSGHTEYIAEITEGYPVMMLTVPGLRVALATTHLPLAEVTRAITADRLERVIRVLSHDLTVHFGIAAPRIVVCGLNPHAGEGGYLGREEIDVIEPLLAKLARDGVCVTGPLPADTVFLSKQLEHADAVLAMYHDQGLPVLKYAGFGRAVNVTLGLPIIRTSVDHGTALDLAGTGRADPGSLKAAIETAIEMVKRSRP